MCGDNQTLGLFILERTICAKSPTQCRWKCFPRLQILSCGWAAYAGNIFFLQIWVMPNVHRFGPFQSWHSAVTCLQVASNSWNIYFPTCIRTYICIYIMCIYILYTLYYILYEICLNQIWSCFQVFFLSLPVLSVLGAIPVNTWSFVGSCVSRRRWPPGHSCNSVRVGRPPCRFLGADWWWLVLWW